MTKEKKQEYVDLIVSGDFPKQDTFTPEETFYLVQTALVWAANQIDHTTGDTLYTDEDEVEEMVERCEYKSIKEAIIDDRQMAKEEFFDLQVFILNWLK